MEIKIFDHDSYSPLKSFGFTHEFFKINYHTIISTWVVLALLIVIAISLKIFNKKALLYNYLIKKYVLSFENIVTQAIGEYDRTHTIFASYLFTFLLLCNCISVLPFTEEPTTDINTTLALGVISFLYIQIMAARAHGFLNYLKGYFEPFIFFFPLNIIGNLATVISLSFRLFGNILGGSVVSGLFKSFITGSVLTEILGIATGLNFIIIGYFGIFDGILQAFVFTMLSITYLGIEIQKDNS